MKFYRNFPLIVSVLFRGFLNHLQIEDESVYCAGDEHCWSGGQTCFALVMNALLVLEMNALKTRVQTSAPHTQLRIYQQLSNRTYLEMIAIYRYSPPTTGCSYHALLLTSEYTTTTIPTSNICNSVLCCAKQPSSRLSC